MKTKFWNIISVLFVLFLAATPALAQEGSELQLRLRRNFGYSSGSQIQGNFTMTASGPEDLERVVFLLDGEPLGEVSEAPFSLAFVTDVYPLGEHTLSAVGYTRGGQELRSNEINRTFVSPDAGWQAAMRIVGPLVGLTLVAMVVGLVLPFLVGRGKKEHVPLGAERKYGVAGGAICPRCGRPFPLRILSMNLSPVHRVDRCPHCGKWGVMRRRPLNELREAERLELEQAQTSGQAGIESEEERLRRELDRSRYQDY